MYPDLALEISVGELTRDLDGRGLDARFLAREEIHHLGLEPHSLGPPQVHAGEHLSPVLGLRSARARVNGEDGVLPVLRTREHDLDGKGLEVLLKGDETLLDAGRLALVAGLRRHFPQHTEILGFADQLLEASDRPREIGALLHERLGLAAIIPEARSGHLLVDYRDARVLGFEVKDAPGDPACASRR